MFNSLHHTIFAIGYWALCDENSFGVRSVCLVFENRSSKLLCDWLTLSPVSVLVGVISPTLYVSGFFMRSDIPYSCGHRRQLSFNFGQSYDGGALPEHFRVCHFHYIGVGSVTHYTFDVYISIICCPSFFFVLNQLVCIFAKHKFR